MKKFLVLTILSFTLQSLAQLPAYVPANGLVGYWPFDNNANDLGPFQNHGTVTGAQAVNDRFNVVAKAYDFNGLNNYIRVPNHSSLSGFPELTMALWIKVDTLDGDHAMIAKWYQQLNCGSKSDNYICHLQYGFIQFVLDFTNTVGLPATPPLTSAYLNTWKHLAFVYRNNTALEVYSDGTLLYTTPVNGAGLCTSTNDLFFGADVVQSSTPNSRFFSGAMDEIGIWSRALSACEIRQLYLATHLSVSATASMVCRGGSAVITASGASSYSINGTVFTSSAVVTPSSTTVYQVIGNYGLPACQDTVSVLVQVSDCTGLEVHDSWTQVEIFPNPSSGWLNLRIEESADVVFSVSLEDYTGKQVMHYHQLKGTAQLDLGSLPNGLYVLRLLDEHGELRRTEKISIQK